MKPRKLTAEIEERVASQMRELAPWFHNIEIAEGVFTNPASEYPLNRWRIVEPEIPEDLGGKVCLDVGCSSGFFSIKLKEGGAQRVVGIDGGEQPLAIKQAKFATDALGMDNIEFHELSVYDVDKLNMRFDCTLFLGVLYHLRHPLLALDKLRQVTTGKMILQTVTTKVEDDTKKETDYAKRPEFIKDIPLDDIPLRSSAYYEPGYPKLHFIENKMQGDFSNRWLPNVECVTAMLRSSGFRIEKLYILDHEVYVVCS